MNALRTSLRGACCALLMLAVLGCQPVDTTPTGVPSPTEPVAAGQRVGAPVTGLPGDAPGILAQFRSTAESWVSDARPVEVVLTLNGDHAPTDARVTYLAPDADRFLLLRVSAEGVSQERPTFEGLALEPVPAAALEQVPAFPDVPDPAALVDTAQEARDSCGVADDVEVLVYATGAPASWDGRAWTEPPVWTATLSDGDAAVVVDPVTGALTPPGCV